MQYGTYDARGKNCKSDINYRMLKEKMKCAFDLKIGTSRVRIWFQYQSIVLQIQCQCNPIYLYFITYEFSLSFSLPDFSVF